MLRFFWRIGASENTEKLTVQQFIAIRNKGTLARRLIELVGLSKKRGKDTGKIGFKGSGTKLAATASVRSRLATSMSSTDSRGQYYLQFTSAPVTIEEDGYVIRSEEVVYRYWKLEHGKPVSDGILETRFVTDGFADWDTPIGHDGNRAFKIVREHICNAYDEDPLFSFHEVPDTHLNFAPAGETVVYIQLTKDVRAVFDNLGRYFKFLSHNVPVMSVLGVGSIWPKSDPNSSRRFIRQVLAGCETDAEDRSLYDYSVDDRMLLSEERILNNEHGFKMRVGRLLLYLRDSALAERMLVQIYAGNAPFEADALATIDAFDLSFLAGKAFWRKIVNDVFGGSIAVHSANEYANLEAAQMYGHNVIGMGNVSLRNFLLRLGFPLTESLIPRDIMQHIVQVAFEDLSYDGMKMFTEAHSYFAKHYPDYARIPVAFFRPKRENSPEVANHAGFSGSGTGHFKEIWIKVNKDGSFPSVADLIATLGHEARHCVSKAHDYERRFMHFADRDIVMSVLRHEGIPHYDPQTRVRGWGTHVPPIFVPTPDELLDLDLEDLKDPHK